MSPSLPIFCLTFRFHQPRRLKHYTFFDIGESALYEDEDRALESMKGAAQNWYLPVTELLLRHVREYQGDFRISLSLSGSFLHLCERASPAVLDRLKSLSDTGCVEWVNEPHYHSLASLASPQEFREQIILHADTLKNLFGQSPLAFRNTGLIYSDAIAREVESLGHRVMFAGNTEIIAGPQTANQGLRPITCETLQVLLLKELTFPGGLPVPKGTNSGSVISLAFDRNPLDASPQETTCLLDYLGELPHALLARRQGLFQTPTRIALGRQPLTTVSSEAPIAPGRDNHDLSWWIGDEMQKDAYHALYLIENQVKAHRDAASLNTWRMLQDADYLEAMRTEGTPSRSRHGYNSPYDAYINYMNILTDFTERISRDT